MTLLSILVLGPMVVGQSSPAEPPLARAARGAVVLTERARALHARSLVVDGHNDLPWELREKADGSFDLRDIAKPQPTMHTDIPRLRRGGIGLQFWSAYVPSSTAKRPGAAHATLEQIDVILRMIERYPGDFEMARTTDDVLRIRRAGKIASMIGIEGGHSIENSLAILRVYERLGARYMTLTHSETIDWADSATDEARHGGLSPFGEEVVREMNRIGMLIDISHVSPATMKDAIAISEAPVIASHSSAFGVAAHPRNVPDDVLDLLEQKDGVVMVNFFSGFVVPEGARAMAKMFQAMREIEAKYPEKADREAAMAAWRRENPFPAGTIHHLIDHIDHIAKIAGPEHVGLGSDFDGVVKLPDQLSDVSCYPLITQALLDRGYTDADVEKILGGNLLRVLRKAETVAGKGRS